MNKALTLCYGLFSVCFLTFHTIQAQNCADLNGTIWVTNNNDTGEGSLREAILCANTTVGANAIRFNIPGNGPHAIFVGAENGVELPALLDGNTLIDATTQPGYTGNPVIVLDGQNTVWTIPINAIWIRADNCAVYGLEIRNFPDDGIDVRDSDNAIIGAAGKGNYVHNNGDPTDFFPGLPGTGPWEGCGIVVRNGSKNCSIQGNTISENEYCGIIIRDGGDDHQIGGSESGASNSIHNNAAGIRINANTNGTSILQNALFCNDSLAIDLISNANNGIVAPEITDAQALVISGTANPGDRVEVFLSDDTSCPDVVCQGKIFLGAVTALDGNWTLSGPFLNGITQLTGGQSITASATDAGNNTSEFSTCKVVTGVSFCTDEFGDIWVTTASDSGAGSLREAIICANETQGANTIKFNIPGITRHVIAVGSLTQAALPALLDEGTVIDATTQPGFGLNGESKPMIILDGQSHDWTGPINALWIRSDYCEVYGLEIVNFPDDGIDVTGADYVKIGAASKGNVIYNNGWEQDFFPDAPGTGPWNGCGIVMKRGAEYCEIKGNIVGTNYEQSDTSGNELCGIVVQHGGDDNTIGGTNNGEGNIIANHSIGILVSNNSFSTTINRNSMYCNDSIPILLLGNANLQYAPPQFDSVTTTFISGFADSLDRVEVFISVDSLCEGVPCQGTVFLGSAQVVDSTWVLEVPFENGVTINNGDFITSTATDTLGNTSIFAPCLEVISEVELEAAITELTHTSCGNNNGSFIVQVTSGSSPYVYDIGNGPIGNPEFMALTPGNYTIQVEDADARSLTLNATVFASSAPNVLVSQITEAACGQNIGSFLVGALGGAPPYSFDIGNGPTNNPQFSDLSAGNYMVTVSDQNNCKDTEQVTINAAGVPEAEIINIFDSSCDGNNGSFSVSASSGTPPYLYDIGGGQTLNSEFANLAAGSYTVTVTDVNQCNTTAVSTIFETGTPVLNINNVEQESCQLSNGTFTVTANGGVSGYLYDIGDGPSGNATFSGLAAGNYTVTVTDALACSTTSSIALSNEGLAPFSEFTFGMIEATVSFTSLSIAAVNYLWDFDDGQTSTAENPNHIYNESGNYLVCLTTFNDCGEKTFCENISVNLPLALVNIYGNMAKVNGQTVEDVTVNCTNAGAFETLADGDYEFLDLPAGGSYLLEPVKDFNHSNGLSALDIFLISQHILNVEPLDSPYKIIAADADNNGSISALDLFRIRQIILNNVDAFPNNTSWRFVPQDFVFPDPANPLGFPFPETIMLNDLNEDAFNQDFVAIKVGDVNLSSDPTMFNDPVDEIRMTVFQEVLEDETILLSFRSAEDQQFVAFQTDVCLKNYGLRFSELLAGSIDPVYKVFESEKDLKLLWYHDGNTPNRRFTKGEVLFELKCKKQGFDPGKLKSMQFEKSIAYEQGGEAFAIQLEMETAESFDFVKVSPNPFESAATIEFNQNEPGNMKIQLFSSQGDRVYQSETFFEKGRQQLDLELSDFPSGIYFYELKSTQAVWSGKLIKK